MPWYKDKRHIHQRGNRMEKPKSFPYFAEALAKGEEITFDEIRNALILEAIWIKQILEKKMSSISSLREHLEHFRSLQQMIWGLAAKNKDASALAKSIALIPHQVDKRGLRKLIEIVSSLPRKETQ